MTYPIKSPRKLIEVALPLDAINVAAVRECYIYKGNPSAIHKWWAQRPLAAARAVRAYIVTGAGHIELFPAQVTSKRIPDWRHRRSSHAGSSEWHGICLAGRGSPRCAQPQPLAHLITDRSGVRAWQYAVHRERSITLQNATLLSLAWSWNVGTLLSLLPVQVDCSAERAAGLSL